MASMRADGGCEVAREAPECDRGPLLEEPAVAVAVAAPGRRRAQWGRWACGTAAIPASALLLTLLAAAAVALSHRGASWGPLAPARAGSAATVSLRAASAGRPFEVKAALERRPKDSHKEEEALKDAMSVLLGVAGGPEVDEHTESDEKADKKRLELAKKKKEELRRKKQREEELRKKKEKAEWEKEKEKKEKEKKAAEKREHRREVMEARKRLVIAREKDEAIQTPSLYCFALMLPFGYEPWLLKEQHEKDAGIFTCNEHVVISNTTVLLKPRGEKAPVKVTVISGSLAVKFGGRYHTAMNTGVFNRVWTEIIRLGRYRFHDWTVKADPDSVFFPARLRQLLRHSTPMNTLKVAAVEPPELRCGLCEQPGHNTDSCASRVQWHQKQGLGCQAALNATARPSPQDCGCTCDDFACTFPDDDAAMYLNNCKFGLHGPIEVLSRRAVAMFGAGLPQCTDLLERPWGEDMFLDKCLRQLGVKRVNKFSLLSETACMETPMPCGSSDVAFHPFKTTTGWFSCWGFANKYGHGPAAPKPNASDMELLMD